MPILAIIIFMISLFVFFIAVLAMFFLALEIITTRVPFVPLPKEVVPMVCQAMEIKKGSVVYDLGCGDGRVLIAGYKMEPEARFIGFDKNFIPFFISWLYLKKIGRSQEIKIFRENFFKKDLSQATHIFTYLSSEVMDDLLPKLERELVSGTCLVSCDFCFFKKRPIKIIELERPPRVLGRKLFVYEF